jgi:hypothetical protein
MAEKRAHATEIQQTAAEHRDRAGELAARAATVPVFTPVTPR